MKWTDISALVGVLIGWMLTQASTWNTNRQVDQRILKETLFFLLELHRQLYKMEYFKKIFPSVQAEMMGKMAGTPEEIQVMGAKMYPALRAIGGVVIAQRLAGLSEKYNASLLKLASVDPIIAHKLNGLESITQLLPQVLSGMEHMSTALDMEMPDMTKLASFMQVHVEDDALEEAARTVREVALEIAPRIGKKTNKQSKEALNNTTEPDDKLIVKFRAYMNKFAEAVRRGEIKM